MPSQLSTLSTGHPLAIHNRPHREFGHLTHAETTRILARWIDDLRRDNRHAQYRIRQLELRLGIEEGMPLDDLYSYWLDSHAPHQIVDLARELEVMA